MGSVLHSAVEIRADDRMAVWPEFGMDEKRIEGLSGEPDLSGLVSGMEKTEGGKEQ